MLNDNLSTLEYYINSNDSAPGNNIENMFRKCREQLDKLIEDSNQFFEKDWNQYQEKINNIEVELFKKYEKIEK